MEILILYGVFLTLITIGWLLKNKGTRKPKTRALPPGPYRGLIPWVGESVEFLSKWRKGRSEEFVMERAAKLASPDIFRASFFGDTFAVFCGAAGSKFLTSTAGPLVKSWWPKTFQRLFAQTLQDSQQLNLKALTVLFTSGPSDLHRFVPIMDSLANVHLGSVHWNPVGHHKVVKVYPLVKNYNFALACRVFMSIEDPELVARLEVPMNDLSSGFMAIPIAIPGTRFHRAIKAAKRMKQQLAEIAKERRLLTSVSMSSSTSANEHQDFLQVLLPNLRDMEIADRILGLLVASHDTSTVVISFIFKFLSDYPQVYRLVLEENMEVAAKKSKGELLNWEDVEKLKYSWNVAREAMRIWTPSPAIFREAAQDFSYGGYHIPKGCKLYMNLSSIHKNPQYYAEPEKFDPRRFEGKGPLPNTYLPFGGGSNMCPGRNYARLQILVFLHNVVRRFHWEMVFPNEEIILNPVARFAQGLPVRLRPTTSSGPP